VNSTNTAIHDKFMVGAVTVSLDADAGPYLKIAGSGVSLSVLGQSLGGASTNVRERRQAGSYCTPDVPKKPLANWRTAAHWFGSIQRNPAADRFL
jgi:hypothetical protein